MRVVSICLLIPASFVYPIAAKSSIASLVRSQVIFADFISQTHIIVAVVAVLTWIIIPWEANTDKILSMKHSLLLGLCRTVLR